MTAVAAQLTPRKLLVDIVEEGTITVARDYYLRLADTETVGVDDLRKAMEMGAKIMGAMQPDRTDNLITINWTVNGGSVNYGVSQPTPEQVIEAEVTPVAEVTDVQPKEPVPHNFALVEDLLNSVDSV